MVLYPLKFKPRLIEKIWGGRKLETQLGKSLPPGKNVGEAWEIYDFPPGVCDNSGKWTSSVVANGPLAGRTLHELIEQCRSELLGDVPLGPQKQFPLLIKFLDAREDLSVQVHPDARYAATHPKAHLKTEAWYVIESAPGARIYKGLNPGVSPDRFRESIERGECERHLRAIPVEAGDCHFLPSGTVHALGAGILVAEVQTPSDTTFRVYDFNRLEKGKPRQLHVDQALECIDFSPPTGTRPVNNSQEAHRAPLVECDYFTIQKQHLSRTMERSHQPLAIWMVLEGEARISHSASDEPVTLRKGQTILLPAAMARAMIEPSCEFNYLEVTIPVRGATDAR